MKVYTKRGDAGETDLFGSGRVTKDDRRVDAYGEVDELNACVGQALANGVLPELVEPLTRVQNALFDIGSFLATPRADVREKNGFAEVGQADVAVLEGLIDQYDEELPPLTAFVLPGGCTAAAAFHLARTVCRRAERRVVSLHREEKLGGYALEYLNRLSDLFFTLARLENHRAGVRETEWVGRSS
jgi:cob(I)alamin adenosyltransferase